MVELVEKMLASGAAYVLDPEIAEYPDVYYRADATPQFGYESGYDRDTMLQLFAERGGDPRRPGKTDELDALLWRAARPGEPSWADVNRDVIRTVGMPGNTYFGWMCLVGLILA